MVGHGPRVARDAARSPHVAVRAARFAGYSGLSPGGVAATWRTPVEKCLAVALRSSRGGPWRNLSPRVHFAWRSMPGLTRFGFCLFLVNDRAVHLGCSSDAGRVALCGATVPPWRRRSVVQARQGSAWTLPRWAWRSGRVRSCARGGYGWATVPAWPWRRCVAWTFGLPVPSSRATVLSHSGPVHLHLGAVAYVVAPVALPVETLRP